MNLTAPQPTATQQRPTQRPTNHNHTWIQPLRMLWSVLLLVSCSTPPPAAPTAVPKQAPILATAELPVLPTIAPAGRGLPGRLLFSASGDLWAWEGERGRRLTQSGDAYQPAISPDGAQIAFVRRSQSASDLMLLSTSSDEPQLLLGYTPDLPLGSLDRVYQSIWAFYPAWSPDGQSLAFVSQYGPPYGSPASDYRLGLFGMPAQRGGERTMYYTDQSGHVGRLAYAPDGSGIFFALAPDPPGIARIYRYDMASGEAGEIPNIPEQSYDPAISQDGRLLAFAARHGSETDIFVLRLDRQSVPLQISHTGAARAPAFSPDGAHLAFLSAGGSERSFDLWVADLRGATTILSASEPERLSFDMRIDADSGVSWGR